MSTRVVYRLTVKAAEGMPYIAAHYDYLKPEHGTRKVTLTTKVKPKGHNWNWALIQLAKGKAVRRMHGEVAVVLREGTPSWKNGAKLGHDTLYLAATHTDWVLA